MRKTLIWQTTRKALTATALAAFVTGGAFAMSGTASAATTLANSCMGSVTGSMGDTVALQGSGVSDVVKAAAQKNEIFLHFNGVDPSKLAQVVSGKTLTVGQVPNSAGGTVTGASIATAVTQALQNEGALGESLLGTKAKTLQLIKDGVVSNCALTTVASNYSAPTTPGTNQGTGGQNSGTTNGSTGTYAPGTPGNLSLGTGSGTSPQRDYGNIPTASPGFAVPPGVRYPSNSPLPGDQQAPQFGIPGSDGQSGQSADVRNAGNAESLASSGAGSDVQLPMLLAVVVLAGVTAALVRTWVLRRV